MDHWKKSSKTDELPGIFERIQEGLQNAKMQIILEKAQERHACLQQFENVPDIITKIKATEATVRDSIIYALLQEFQRTAQEDWGLALMMVMEPMLKNAKRRVLGHFVESVDLDQMMIEVFWEAISKFDITRHKNKMILRLRKRVYKFFFRQVNKAQRLLQQQEQLKKDVEAYQFNPFEEMEEEDQTDAVVDVLMQSLDGVLPEYKLRLVAHTVIQKRKLREYVRNFSDEYEAEADQERRYQSLKHKRVRALRKIQTILINYIECDETFLAKFRPTNATINMGEANDGTCTRTQV